MNKTLLTLSLTLPFAPLDAVQSLEWAYRTDGPQVHAAFDEVQPFLQKSSAVIKRGRREVIYGTVISPDGHILTKASELGSVKPSVQAVDQDGNDVSELLKFPEQSETSTEDLTVVVGDRDYGQPELLAEDPAWDLALIKIEAEGLTPVDLSDTSEVEQGTWLVANGATTRRERRVQVGILAANSREVNPKGGAVLGVSLGENADESEELVIEEVTEGSGAEAAGLQQGDILRALDDWEIENFKKMLEWLGECQVGDVIDVRIERDGEEQVLEVELSGRVDLFGEQLNRNDFMSGEFSNRRTGFPRILQHDIIGNRHTMGGPVFTLDGRCVGMNIARFSRCETYAIPARELRDIVTGLLGQP